MESAIQALTRNALPIIGFSWLTVGVVYLAGMLGTRQTARRQSSGSGWAQTGLTVLAYWLVFSPQPRIGVLGWRIVPSSSTYVVIGLVLTVAGCALAIWARAALGRNWSATVTIKQDHVLKTGGPYAFVRHPIYSGLILAALGSAIALGYLACFLGFLLLFSTFWIKSRTEESFMRERFGQQYADYRRRVRALIPGLL